MNLIKKISSVLLASSFVLLCQLSLYGQTSFEGVIELKTFNKEVKENANIKWYVKEGDHKLEVSGSSEGYTYDYSILLKKNDPNLKMISKQNGQVLVYDVPPSSKETQTLNSPELVRENESKTIAGYKCNKIKIVTPESTSTCWVTNELNLPVRKFPEWLKSNPVYQVLVQNQVSGFPMQIETISSGGELLYSVKVEKVVPSKLNASEFELPANYIDGEKAIKESFEPK